MFFFSFLLHNLSGAKGWEVLSTTMGFTGVTFAMGDRWDNHLGGIPSGVSDLVQSVTTCCCFTLLLFFFSFLSVLPFLRPNIQKSKICTVAIHFAPIEIQNIPANKSFLVVDSCYTRLILRCPTVRSWAWQECQECYTSHAIHALDP